MSTVKVNRVQVGQSATKDNNFVIDASQDDGTLKISRGVTDDVTEDIIEVDDQGVVSFPKGVDSTLLPLGVGQTWQDVTSSRAYGSTYTNSTGRPILVSLTCSPSSGTQNVDIYVGSVKIGILSTTSGSAAGNFTFLVPPGSTYSTTATSSTLVTWAELR